MKIYIQASKKKPVLDYVYPVWSELTDESGMEYSIYSKDNELLFDEVFEYDVYDSDAIVHSAIDMAILVLSRKYDLTDDVIKTIKGDK